MHRNQLAGDVIFVASPDKGSKLTRLIERLLTGSRSEFSHVMLVAYPGLYVDSMPDRGVKAVRASKYGDLSEKKFKVFRNEKFTLQFGQSAKRSEDSTDQDEIYRKLDEHIDADYRKRYNFWFFLKRVLSSNADNVLFCSEFVARTLRALEIDPLHNRPAEKVYPSLLASKLAADECLGWFDVTDVYLEAQKPKPSREKLAIEKGLPPEIQELARQVDQTLRENPFDAEGAAKTVEEHLELRADVKISLEEAEAAKARFIDFLDKLRRKL